jgi:acylphosphatase
MNKFLLTTLLCSTLLCNVINAQNDKFKNLLDKEWKINNDENDNANHRNAYINFQKNNTYYCLVRYADDTSIKIEGTWKSYNDSTIEITLHVENGEDIKTLVDIIKLTQQNLTIKRHNDGIMCSYQIPNFKK